VYRRGLPLISLAGAFWFSGLAAAGSRHFGIYHDAREQALRLAIDCFNVYSKPAK
jgi:hypothetical protein